MISPFSLRTSNWTPLMRSPVSSSFFMIGEAAARCVVEAEGLDLAGLDLDGLWGAVQNIALHRLDLPCGDGGARGQVIDDNAAIFVGDKLAVGITNH